MKRSVYIPDKLWELVEKQCDKFGIDPPNLSHLLQETLMEDFHVVEQSPRPQYVIVETPKNKRVNDV